jgi:glutaredoxin
LGRIHYPLLSDFWPHGAVAERYGVLCPSGYSERAIFIINSNGIIEYIDIHDIDKQPSNEVLFKELARINPKFNDEIVARIKPEAAKLPHGGVVMYCTSWCPDCKLARAWLKANNIQYTEVDVTIFPGAAEQVRKWANGNLTTPTFDVDGKILVNFDEAKLAAILKSK